MTDDWQVVEEALIEVGYAKSDDPRSSLARLREREAHWYDEHNTARASEEIERQRAEAAEARVVELVESAREGWQAHADEEARVARLEGLLLQCASGFQATHPEMAKRLRTVVHEEEK